ncbi:hypothetical protein ACIBQX_11410 [Nonomuraea sp. NPDC049714]|uniref:hypothetical protein n=1 Tax=Nonomuraea sp. NPDC049714 TaxID=3364357 RepID=UPI0037A6E5F7
MSSRFWQHFHLAATITWIALMIPSLLWWKDSIPWLVIMSVWANVAGHWSSWQASRAERKQDA